MRTTLTITLTYDLECDDAQADVADMIYDHIACCNPAGVRTDEMNHTHGYTLQERLDD
jgi:hypothetical protein